MQTAEIPDTPACAYAYEVMEAYLSPALRNHSMRSYLWAAALGTSRGIAFDPELLYVASVLHDLGLVKEFDNHTEPFEVAGGHVGWVFAAGAGWPAERRKRVSEVVVRHQLQDVDPAEDPEGFLLMMSTGFDIAGRAAEEYPDSLRSEVLERWPRLDLADQFLRCFQDQAGRKPDSTAAGALRSNLAARMAENPLEQAAQRREVVAHVAD